MIELLPDWYRSIELEPKIEMISNRKKSIEELEKSSDLILNLIKLFYGKAVPESFVDYLNKTFRENDQVFPIKNNLLELRLLSGAAIVFFLEDDKGAFYKDLAAYAVICGSYGYKSEVLIPEIFSFAENYLSEEALRIRKLDDVDIDDLNIETLVDNNAQIIPAINNLATSVNKIIQQAKKSKNQIDILKEEINILWWIFGEYSNTLKCKIAKLEEAAIIVTAAELAKHTYFIPEPTSAKAFLDKMLSFIGSKKCSLQFCIDKCQQKWKSNWIKGLNIQRIPELCPILFAINKSVETGGEQWTAVFSKSTELDPDLSDIPIELSYQLYREIMLINAINECD